MYADMRLYAGNDRPLARVARVHKALSDETRLRIVHLLLVYEELCVCDVEALLEVSQSRASRNLKALKQAGLIDGRRQGTWAYYRIPDGLLPLLTPLAGTLRADPRVRGDLERGRSYRRDPSCDAPPRPPRRKATRR